MKTIISRFLLLMALLLCFALPFSATDCYAEAQTYTITEAELAQLEINLTELEKINEQSQAELTQLKGQLTNCRIDLAQAQIQLAQLKSQLSELKKASSEQDELLKTANESLKKYAQEEKEKQRRIKQQRNIAYILLAGAVYAALK